jgi:hypothetical protein
MRRLALAVPDQNIRCKNQGIAEVTSALRRRRTPMVRIVLTIQ